MMPLKLAARDRDGKVLAHLLQNSSDVQPKQSIGLAATSQAASNGHVERPARREAEPDCTAASVVTTWPGYAAFALGGPVTGHTLKMFAALLASPPCRGNLAVHLCRAWQ